MSSKTISLAPRCSRVARARWGSLSLLALSLVIACGLRESESPRVLRITYPSTVVSLDPHLHTDSHTYSLLNNVYEGLTAFDAQMTLRPALAESWHNPSELEWRFIVRRGVLFHDGRPVTTADVVASLERAKLHPRSAVSSFLVPVESIEAIDENTIGIRTSKPYPLLGNKLTFVAIVPRDAPGEIKHPIGTAPFRFASLDKKTTLNLQAFSEAWSGAPYWDEVRFEFEPSSRRRAELWQDGQVDIAAMLSAEEAELLSDSRKGLVWQDDAAVSFLALQIDTPPFSDLRVRRGISLGLDREAAAARLHDEVVPIAQLVSPHIYGHVPKLEPIQPDLEAARELLDEAGLITGSELTLEVSTRLATQAGVVAALLSEIGLEVRVVERPWQDLYQRLIAGEVSFMLATYSCISGDASDLFDAALHTSDPEGGWGSINFMRYSNPELDRLIEQASNTAHMPRRLRLMSESTRLVLADLPMIPLWHSRFLHAVRPDLAWQPRRDGHLLAAEVTPAD